MKLGPIAEWGLNMSKKTIEVNSQILKQTKKVFLQLVTSVLIRKVKINPFRVS